MAFSPRMAKCEYCRGEFVKRSTTHKFCSEKCREKHKYERACEREREKKKRRSSLSTLGEKIEQARALGIDYGLYSAVLEGRIKLNEIKHKGKDGLICWN